jgi:hypothetical protein
MKIARVLCSTLALLAIFESSKTLAQTNVGQWNFQGNLQPVIGAAPLSFADATTVSGTEFSNTAVFGISPINGTNATVMYFPISGATGGYSMPTTALQANGGGTLVNNYTIVMDVLFPANESAQVRPLVQTDDAVLTPDADFVVDTTGGIGAPPGPYSGAILPNTWYRVAFSVTANEIDKFINGVEVGTQPTGGADSRFALAQGGAPAPSGYALLFQNSTTNGAADGYVSSLQLWNDALSAGQIAALGTPSADKIPTNITSIPSYVTGKVPSPNANSVPPVTSIAGVLNPGGATIDSNSISMTLDGASLDFTNSYDGTNYSLSASPTNVYPAFSLHTVAIIYTDSVVGHTTNSWTFTVFGYQSVTLPAPIYFESFDEVPEGGIPAGWTVTNWTDSLAAGTNLDNTQSDSYLNWVTIGQAHYFSVYPDTNDYTSPGFPNVAGNSRQMTPPIVENGVFLTNLCSGNLMVAESDQRGGNQVQVMFTSDYDFTGHSNIYVSFHNMNEQNQDNVCSVEYSIDGGTNWLPLLYMLDDGTTDADGSDVVTNAATGQIDAVATFSTARSDQAHGLAYGAFIGAPISSNLAPYIRPCRNDDPVQQKRIEVFGLPAAANQKAVRLRFMQAGTGSWFFDIDDLGFYSIPQPIFLVQPQPVLADFNGPAVFSAEVGGTDLTYQWSFGGSNIVGASSSTYVIPNTISNNTGLYTVIAGNSFGSVTSSPISLTLVFTPIILSSPQDLTIAPSDPASFTVQARGGRPLSYQWFMDGGLITGATNSTYSITNSTTNDSGLYSVQISNIFSTVSAKPADLTVYSGPITNSMIAHYTFDGSYSDVTGNGNDGLPVGTPTFEPGILGMAIHTTTSGTPANAPATNNYVTLGMDPELNFGSDYNGDSSDFSVSFWVQILHQNDDQSFIGNKDWNSGSNPGWIIDSEGDGMKWNYRDDAINITGVGSSRRDSPHVGPQLEDGGWHHVLVTFARHSVGTTYVDGALANVTSIAPDVGSIGGSLDTSGLGYSLNIGQDGTGHYTDGGSSSSIDMRVDDLAIWGRVLNSHEALGIFNAGLNSNTVDQASVDSVGVKPEIQIQPADQSATPGQSVSLYASVLGSPTLTYQWFFGTTNIANATNSAYTITNLQAGSSGSYSVIVSNSYGLATSRVASVTYIPAPNVTVNPVGEVVDVGGSVTFSASASGGQPITYWWVNGTNVVPNSGSTNLTLSNVQLTNAGSYHLVASNSFGSAMTAPAVLKVWQGPIVSNLVVHLTFDGNLDDSSGRTNNATYATNGANADPNPTFVPGKIGEAFEYTTTTNALVQEYATLGYPADLQFDSTNDFSVSFWANYTNQNDDLPFIANKDWNSSGNPGWGIMTQGGGNFRVNVDGPAGSADKYDQSGTPSTLKNGNWHNIVVSFQRAPAGTSAYVYEYLDGILVLKNAAAVQGSIDTLGLTFTNEQSVPSNNQTNWAVNIGQDGTGVYHDGGSAYDINAKIDDLGIWRRALTPKEAAAIFAAGQSGEDLTKAVVGASTGGGTTLSATVSGGNLILTWQGSATVELETTPSLSPEAWTPVPGTLGASSASIPLNASASAFFRLVQVQ